MAYAFNDDKGKYDLDENVLGGASNTLYDAELAIAENAADIASLHDSLNGVLRVNLVPTGNAGSSMSYGYVTRIGRLCILEARFTNIASYTPPLKLATVPEAFRPSYTAYGPVGFTAPKTNNIATLSGYAYVSMNGDVAIDGPLSQAFINMIYWCTATVE